MSFPRGFIWGAATASYQIEGTSMQDGGGKSIWDMFSHTPGKVFNGETGDVACDHYHLWREDIALMQELKLQAYRFSLSWPRIMPDGVGAVNPVGLEFYDRLVDGLLEAGIQPYVTLFHWDLPYELYCRGGWLNRDCVEWFADYAKVVVDRLGDRVLNWMTLNEPQCIVGLGMESGQHAPGDKLSKAEILRAAHHTQVAHGRAVQTLRSGTKIPCRIGYAPVGVAKYPITNSVEDVAAAREAMFSMKTDSTWNNTWWMDPIFLGGYPEDGMKLFADKLPPILPGDMETIAQPLDFFGANIYNAQPVKMGKDGPEDVEHAVGIGRTTYHWPVTPEALYWGPKFFYERYKKPIIITENGLGNTDWVGVDGKVHDGARIDFLTRYLREYERAIADGVDAIGYFQWSLMDNFEWNEGYKLRFGLTHVDYQTLKRTPKDSAEWYSRVIETNGATL